jgi:hypothetical protein
MHSLKGTPWSPSTTTRMLLSSPVLSSIRNKDSFSFKASSTKDLTLFTSIAIPFAFQNIGIKRGDFLSPPTQYVVIFAANIANPLILTKIRRPFNKFY